MNSSFLALTCLNLTRAVNFDVLSLIWSHFNSLTIQLIYFILFFFYFYRKSVACRVKLLDVQAKISAIIISCLMVLWCFRRLLVNNVWVVGLCGISKSRFFKNRSLCATFFGVWPYYQSFWSTLLGLSCSSFVRNNFFQEEVNWFK